MSDEGDKKPPHRPPPKPRKPKTRKPPQAGGANRDGKTDEGVGYRRPPVSGQFKRGQSGNPKGRPKRPANMAEAYIQALNRKVRTPDGETKAMYEIIALRAVTDAANGKRGALKDLAYQLEKLHASGQLRNPEEEKRRAETADLIAKELRDGHFAQMALELYQLFLPVLPAAFLLEFDKRARSAAETKLLEDRTKLEPEINSELYQRRRAGLPDEDEDDF
jgi:hypothetical protein